VAGTAIQPLGVAARQEQRPARFGVSGHVRGQTPAVAWRDA
jgi:hypothetical protein